MKIKTLRNKIANSTVANLVDASTNDTEIIFIAFKAKLITLAEAVRVYAQINPQHVRSCYTGNKTVVFDNLLDFATNMTLGFA